MSEIGKLYIVAMPIGDPEDITLRALRVLRDADMIAAEDTRNTRRMLAWHCIENNLISYHEHNEDERSGELLRKMENGESVALVSDAGTPAVSDPGYRLIRRAVDAGVPVIPVPGPSAVIAALSASGLPTDAFVFLGFPPKKAGRRSEWLGDVKDDPRTLIFYQSPARMLDFLDELIETLGDREAVLARELTKPYEEFLRGLLSELRAELAGRKAIKGEFTVLVSGADTTEAADPDVIRSEIEAGLADGVGVSALSKALARKFGVPKQTIYSQALHITKERDHDS